jgi:GNAT superfamily N-acetyltransferase
MRRPVEAIGVKLDHLIVRAPSPGDARALGEIWYQGELASLQESYPGRMPTEWFALPSVDWCEEYWDFHIPTPGTGSRIFVAERLGVVLGFGHSGPPEDADDPGGQLHSLYVRPEAWGTGIGSSLLAQAVAHLAETGYDAAILWAVQGNLRSRSFYEARGWRADGRFMRARNGLPLVRYALTL